MRISWTQHLVALAVAALAVLARVVDPAPVASVRLSTFDTYQRLSPRVPDPAHRVLVVDIDESSLARLGQWPWPRTRLAEMIDRLKAAGVASIAVDLILAEPDRLSPSELARHLAGVPAVATLLEAAGSLPDNDLALARSLAGARVVLGISGEPRGEESNLPRPKAAFATAGDHPALFAPAFTAATRCLEAVCAAAQGLGAVNWLPEGDQIVRRVPLVVSLAGQLYPSLSLEQLRVSEGQSTILVSSSGASGLTAFGAHGGIESVRIGERTFLTDRDGEMWLRFAPYQSSRYVPAWKVLDGSASADVFADRHVVIGASAAGLLDLRATPIDAAVPGVEIHAGALEQLLAGDYLVRPAWATGAEIILLALVSALVYWLITSLGPPLAAAAAALSIAAALLLSWIAYSTAGLLFDPIYPSGSIAGLYVAGSLSRYILGERERRRIRGAFGHYVAAPLVDELAADPSRLKLGGEQRTVTILFADVRSFSRLSEGLGAEDLVKFVNELFTPLADIILERRGTIDKFMGDAVMAFWNAPIEDLQHARNAACTALEMQERLSSLNTEWEKRARMSGARHVPVRLGIGLNTGVCVVGNVGSPQRFDYSVLGDAVNTASRIEEATKTYGAPIIAGEATARSAPGLAFLEIGVTALRGKTREERLFALVGDERVREGPGFSVLERHHRELVDALLQGDRSRAQNALARCREAGVPGAAALLEAYATGVEKL